MRNFLEETLDAIKDSGHDVDEITFIGSEESGHRCEWAEFIELANFEYDNSYGAAKIATDLVIRFTDGQKLWRGEYDGSEWWEFSTPAPPVQKNCKRIKALCVTKNEIGWRVLADLNE